MEAEARYSNTGLCLVESETLVRAGWALAENAVKLYAHPARTPEPILVRGKHCMYVIESRSSN